eukprot:403374181
MQQNVQELSDLVNLNADQAIETQAMPTQKADDGSSSTIVRSLSQAQKAYDQALMISGMKTSDQLKEEYKKEDEKSLEDPNNHKLSESAETFKGICDVNKESEEEFKFMVGTIILQYLLNFDKVQNRALEFPPCINAHGRTIIHNMANFLGIASLSQGKGPTRRIFVFPKHLFEIAQQKEQKKQATDKDKLKIKFKDFKFNGEPDENATNTRDRMLRELYFEQLGQEDPKQVKPWDGPYEVRIPQLQRQLNVIKENCKKLADQYTKLKESQDQLESKLNSNNVQEESKSKGGISDTTKKSKSKPQVIDYVGNLDQKGVEECKSDQKERLQLNKLVQDADSDDEQQRLKELHDEEFQMMSEEQKQAYREKQDRIKKEKQQEFEKLESYHKQLKQTNLKQFKDKPDSINEVRCVYLDGDMLVIEWDPPADNNSPIKKYHVYLADQTVSTKLNLQQNEQSQLVKEKTLKKINTTEDTFWEFTDLLPGTGYYIQVTAENDMGEGYQAKIPHLIQTQSFQNHTKSPSSLYVWGNNSNSELGMQDEQAKENESNYINHSLRKIVKNKCFNTGSVVQCAPGNVHSLFLYIDQDSRGETQILQTGQSLIQKQDHQNQDKMTYTEEEIDGKLDQIPSVPFSVFFNIPVVKVSCGDQFSAILTAEGQVFTWGLNISGQLGLSNVTVAAAIAPQLVKFSNPKDKIIDISVGYNHMLAQTDSYQVYVWGKRMGIYQQFDLNFNSIKASINLQLNEMNQFEPRLLKGNLIYYKIKRVIAGQCNSALISDKGELLIHGLNDQGQLGVGAELGSVLYFFPEFMKVDFFSIKKLKVIDVQFGFLHTLVLCYDPQTNQNRLFGCGHSKFGQLLHKQENVLFDFQELTSMLVDSKTNDPIEIQQIAAGSLHTLILGKDGKLYGCGKNSKGQLGFKNKGKADKYILSPIELQIPKGQKEKIKDIKCGSLYSMAICQELVE